MAARALAAGVPVQRFVEDVPLGAVAGDVVIDAIFGTGLTRAPEGRFAAAIAAIAAARRGGAHVLSADLPSGLSADTGQPLGPCVEADATVTFGVQKRGLMLYPGLELAGAVTVADIGLPVAAIEEVPERCRLLEEPEARAPGPAPRAGWRTRATPAACWWWPGRRGRPARRTWRSPGRCAAAPGW